jgi:hypothetical protein
MVQSSSRHVCRSTSKQAQFSTTTQQPLEAAAFMA